MSLVSRLATACLALTLFAGSAAAQNGESDRGSSQTSTVEIAQPDSETAKLAMRMLDEPLELGAFTCVVSDLETTLQSLFPSLGVFVDQRAVQLAGLKPDLPIQAIIPEMPMRAALRKLLQPLGLKVNVVEEGLEITADFERLVQRNLALETPINSGDAANEAIRRKMNVQVSLSEVEQPLSDVILRLSTETEIPMKIDARALEEIGLDSFEPMSMSLEKVSLRSALRLLLRELDLTYIIKNEVLIVTTIEAAEQNLVTRVYFLEGLGLPKGDPKAVVSLIKVLQSSVVPDTWDILGGPSVMQMSHDGNGNRPAMVVGTTVDVHDQIRSLLASIREGQLLPDPSTVR